MEILKKSAGSGAGNFKKRSKLIYGRKSKVKGKNCREIHRKNT